MRQIGVAMPIRLSTDLSQTPANPAAHAPSVAMPIRLSTDLSHAVLDRRARLSLLQCRFGCQRICHKERARAALDARAKLQCRFGCQRICHAAKDFKTDVHYRVAMPIRLSTDLSHESRTYRRRARMPLQCRFGCQRICHLCAPRTAFTETGCNADSVVNGSVTRFGRRGGRTNSPVAMPIRLSTDLSRTGNIAGPRPFIGGTLLFEIFDTNSPFYREDTSF